MRNMSGWMKIDSSYGPVILRISLGIFLLWFGVWQVASPDNWASYVPGWADAVANTTLLIAANGVFEIALSLLLLSGFIVRVAAFIAFIHVLFIAINLGYNDVMVRDLALAAGFFAVFFNGPDRLSKTFGMSRFNDSTKSSISIFNSLPIPGGRFNTFGLSGSAKLYT